MKELREEIELNGLKNGRGIYSRLEITTTNTRFYHRAFDFEGKFVQAGQ